VKFVIPTAILLLLLGTTASAYAQREKGEGERSQGARPAQQQRQAKPAQRQRTQQAARPQQQQSRPAYRAQQGNAGRNQVRVQQSRPGVGNRPGYDHGRISNDHYASRFGSEHSFHVNRSDYDRRRFAYGGYSFGFVDPWPMGWGYSDDVYVVYDGGGYYMYNRVHPGVRLSVNMF
jgi:hypothetical protein